MREFWQIPDWIENISITATPFNPAIGDICNHCGKYISPDEGQQHIQVCKASGTRTYSVNRTTYVEQSYPL